MTLRLQVPVSSSGYLFDLEYNWLGESYVEDYGSGFNHSYEAVIDGELRVSHSYDVSEEEVFARNILCITSKVRCLAVMRLMGQLE